LGGRFCGGRFGSGHLIWRAFGPAGVLVSGIFGQRSFILRAYSGGQSTSKLPRGELMQCS